MIENIEEIKKIRKKLEITQKQLANIAGISQSIIAKIESGKTDPTYSTIKKISEALESQDKNQKHAKEIMNKKIYSLEKEKTVKDAVELMLKKNISQVPIFEKEKILGIVTERDLLFANKDEKLEKHISNNFIILQEDSSITHIKKLLIDYSIIFIIKKGDFIGIITKSDVLNS